jgi:hypothetical protein
MKKSLLLFTFLISTGLAVQSQTVIFDNGPLFDIAGGGSGGANASTLHDAMTTYGAGHALSSGFRVADDIVIPANTTWFIDSLVFFGYQTGSGNNSTINHVNVRIWNGPPGAPSSVVFGDSINDVLITTEWSGTYRTGDFTSTTCAPATCVDRPIMRNAVLVGTSLAAGTYWIDWQTGGTGASGPWAPPVNLGAGNTTTGNSKQYNPTTGAWADLTDGGTLTGQGMPMLVVGSVFTGINEVNNSNEVTIYPNPVRNTATVSMRFAVSKNDQLTFTVYNVIGNVVRKIDNIQSQQFLFDRTGLNNGVYFFELQSGNKVVKNGKIVLQ